MANILEYLDWRGDIPFSVSPFNEVDNLILAEICYTDFEGVMTQDDTLSIVEAARLYFEIHTEEEVVNRDLFFKLAPIILKKASESERFKDVMLKNYINLISVTREEQYSAVTFVLPGDMIYVAFRGTDNTIVGWKEDFNLFFMNETAGQKRAVEYINYYFKDDPRSLMFGGHSKGGNFAVYAAAFCDRDIQDRIVNVYSNDGPGFREEIIKKRGYKRILPRVTSILPEESLVGVMLSNRYENKIIKADAKGIGQHDPMTWQVYGKGFVEADKRTEVSRVVDNTMMKWLSEMSDEDRAVFTDSIFSTLDTTGARTLGELSEGGMKAVSEIIKSLKSMPPEKQAELSLMFKRLIKIGRDEAFLEFKDKAKTKRITKSETKLIPDMTEEEKAVSTDKKKIRKEMIDKRSSMEDMEVTKKSFEICEKIMSMNIYKNSKVILAYMSARHEVDLSYLIGKAIEEGKLVYLPKVESKTDMKFYLYDGNLKLGKFGIKEPVSKAALDEELLKEEGVLMIVPGVAFDKTKNRLGHGGGYYDRFFDKDNKLFKLAVGYDYQILDSVPADEHDKKVDTIVTEKDIL